MIGASGIKNAKFNGAAGEVVKIADDELGRRSLLIHSDVPCFVGGYDVTVDTGMPCDESLEIDTTSAVYIVSNEPVEVRTMSEVN